jgi:hypothetical protein
MSFPRTAEFLWAASVLLVSITATLGAAEVRDKSDPTTAGFYVIVEYQNHDGGPTRLLWGVCERTTDGVRIEQGNGGAGGYPASLLLPRKEEAASREPVGPRRLFVKISPEAYRATLALAAYDPARHADGRVTASDVTSLVSALATYLDLDREILRGHRRTTEMILTAKARQPLREQARPAVPLSRVASQPDPAGEAEAIRQLHSRAEADEHKQEMMTESLKSTALDRSHRREDAYERRTSAFAQRQSAGVEILAREQAEEVEAGNEANAATLASKVAMIQERNGQRMRDAEAHARSVENGFSERGRTRREYWIANGKKMGEMLIAAVTLGAGGGGSMMSGLTSVIGSGQAAEVAASADVAEAAGPGTVINPSADVTPNPTRLAALETSQGYSRLIHDALNGGAGDSRNPEIARLPSTAMRLPMRPEYRPPARPYPSNRDPRRNGPIYTRPNNEVRPPLPDIRELYENSRDKNVSDLADEIQARLKTWNWLQAGNLHDLLGTAPPQNWHPPMLWPQPMPRPYNGPSFMKDTSPPHGPARFKYSEVGPEGFDVYEQDGREIMVPRY